MNNNKLIIELQNELKLLKREQEIEASLEILRAKSMAMKKSEELSDLSLELVKQVQTFGVDSWFCAFNIYGDDPRGSVEWGSNGKMIFPHYYTPREGIFLKYYEAGQSGEEFFVNEIGESECAAHYEYLCSLPVVGETLLQMKENGIPFPKSQIDHVAFFKYGYVLFITFEPTPQTHGIFKRFAKVFEQTYTRFLDLQKAEAQAREAFVEAALERVRSRTMAMQQSDELSDTAAEMFKQIEELGIYPWSCGFNIINSNENTISQWLSSGDGRMVPPFKSPSNEDIFIDFVSAFNRGEGFFVREMGGDSLKSHYEYLTTIPEVGKIAKELQDSGIEFPTFQVFNLAFFKYGYLMFITYEQVPEFQSIFVRFAKVFEQTYTRFLDLKILEAQAIRAQQDLLEIKAARQKAEEALIELRNTQKQLIQSEKMASLGELTAGIAHEIQNPLNFVNNFSEVTEELVEEVMEERLKEKGDRDEKLEEEILSDIKENLAKIHHHGHRASSIVKGMLEHSRTSSGKKELTDINALADEYLRLAFHGLRAKEKAFNSEFKTDFDENLPKIKVVPQDIGRVLLNLINNAFQATMEKGERNKEKGERNKEKGERNKEKGERKKENGDKDYKPLVTVSTQLTAQGSLLIAIKDNGPGIPDNIKDKIFQPFFTTKDTGKGTGLGLSLAYDIVKAHGGTIVMESQIDKGTLFLIQLPIQ